MCMVSKSCLRTSVAMAVAIPNCIGVVASVHAAVISCSHIPQVHGQPKKQTDRRNGTEEHKRVGLGKHAYCRASCKLASCRPLR